MDFAGKCMVVSLLCICFSRIALKFRSQGGRRNAQRKKKRSKFEEDIGKQLDCLKIAQNYERFTIPFIQPEKQRKYTPDFCLFSADCSRMIFIEVKGIFVKEDRDKHLWVRGQSPKNDIRFVFGNSRNKIAKGSKTTYADWCKKNGFLYADKRIPWGWFRELGLMEDA